jgi:hypothetical protein
VLFLVTPSLVLECCHGMECYYYYMRKIA